MSHFALPRVAAPALLVCALTSGHALAQAERLTDPATGLAITVTAPFKASLGSRPGQDAALRVDSTTGKPIGTNNDGGLCTLAFKRAPQNATLGQAEINAHLTRLESRKLMRSALEIVFKVDTGRPVDVLGGVRAVEFSGQPKAGPNFENVRIYTAIMETPKGRTQFICTTSKADFPAALPQFRRLRAAIQPPA